MTSEETVRAVARCALGLDPDGLLQDSLKDSLFSAVIPRATDEVLPAIVSAVLLQLYSELQEGKDVRRAARTAFDKIRQDPEGRVLCPIESIIAQLEEAERSRTLDYSGAKRLSGLPWAMLATLAPSNLALSADGLRLEVDAILHEVEEGFVDPGTGYPEIAAEAGHVASQLRALVQRTMG